MYLENLYLYLSISIYINYIYICQYALQLKWILTKQTCYLVIKKKKKRKKGIRLWISVPPGDGAAGLQWYEEMFLGQQNDLEL